MRPKAPTGETESLNGLLDTMTNVIGVLILMLLASSLTVHQVARTIEKKSTLINKPKTDQISEARLEGARLEKSLAELQSLVMDLESARPSNEDANSLAEAQKSIANRLRDTQLASYTPDSIQANLRTAEQRLASMQAAVALQSEILAQYRASHLVRAPGVAPKPKTRIARVPDPIPPPANSQPVTFLCRYGHVAAYNESKLETLLKQGYAAAIGQEGAQGLPPVELYQKVEAYFAATPIGQDGFRWQVHAEYDTDAQSAKSFIQLRANLKWTDSGLGEGLEKIEVTNSAYRQELQGLSLKTNYLRFLVWPDSFAEYVVAREIADASGWSSGWQPQDVDGIEFIIARTAIKTQSTWEVPRVAKISRRPVVSLYPAGVGVGMGGGGGGGAGGGGGFGGGAGGSID